MKAPPLPFLLLLCAIAYPFASSITDQQDRDALVALHDAWSGFPSSWDTGTDPCDDSWLGVGCDGNSSARVEQLLLINQGLSGILPSQIGELTGLKEVDLSSNPKLGGNLPAAVGKLTNITKFFVQFCNFSGDIPSEIGNLTNIQYLGLTGNSFTGTLPARIGLLKKIHWLDISSNKFEGSLPVSDVSNGVESGLDNLTNAFHFHFQNNSLSGILPSTLFNTDMQLRHLLLYNNMFNGSIPSTIGSLQSIEIIRLDNNAFSGQIPSFHNTTVTLQLNNNKFSGTLPDLSNNTILQILNLGYNQYNAASIPGWVTNLSHLYILSLDSANLTGDIPPEIFQSSDTLSNVTLGSNNLNGTLNLTLAKAALLLVNVTDNQLSGLTGNYTRELLLDSNPICSSNASLCTLTQSPTSPPPPPAVTSCTTACADEYTINVKDTSNCRCARPVVGNITFLATKVPILTDPIGTMMEEGFATGLTLNAGINFNFSESQVVVNVISANQVSVFIFPPNTTDSWRANDATRISYTLKNQDIEFGSIGPLICGFMGTPYENVLVVGNSLSAGAKAGIGIAVAIFVIIVVVIGVYATRQKKRAEKAEEMNKPFAAWIAASDGGTADIPQLKGARWFSLEEIRKCTNNFSQSNEIGEGGYGKVYKGYLLSGDRLAIKRAATDSLQGATEFKNEIELLSRVHHRNLVGLIGFCFEEGEQMLVYEYMPNGTLRECLSGKTGLQMDWERRITLALGSARGIAYLHTEANPPIIHRDIKSSNILLDEKLVAKVADFGLSKLAPDEDGTAPLSTQVKGTLGYLDPDYFMTNRLTDKSDVYSFGVVLLETVTGRQPIQGGKYVVREVRMALKHGGMESVMKTLVDPDLKEYPALEMESLVLLALRCVHDDPFKRPTMGEVVKGLESFLNVSFTPESLDLGQERAELYKDGSPFMQQGYGTSFEYTGSYGEMQRPLKPL